VAARWWFEPRYPWATYFHRPGIATPRPPRFVAVNRTPSWETPAAEAPREHECDQW